MVIVLNHTICAAYLYFRDCNRFLLRGNVEKPNSNNLPVDRSGFASGKNLTASAKCYDAKAGEGFPKTLRLQEVCVKLCGAADLDELRRCVTEAVKLILPNSGVVVLYLAEPDNEDLVSCEGKRHTLPRTGFAWQSFSSKKQVIAPAKEVSDPQLTALLHLSSAPQPLVLSLPVVDQLSKEVLAVLLTTCDSPTEEEQSCLQSLAEQLSSCHRRMRQSCVPSSSLLKSRTDSILQLCAELYDQDAASLQIKVIKYLQQQTGAQCGFVLLVVAEAKELFCQVVGDKVLLEEIRFPTESSCFALAMESKQPISLDQINKEGREEVERLVGCGVASLVCVPVASRANGQLIALMCLINKLNSTRFNDDDVQTVQHCFKYTSTVLTSTLAVQNERRLKNETQTLLQVARNLFTHLDDLTTLLSQIMQEARNLTKAERCSVFLIDDHEEELVAMVFDGVTKDNNEVQKEIRIPINQGIAGHVATTGELLNIRDAYSHPLFYRGIDESTGFRTRNILCFPIKDENSRVIGVAQLCNKKTGPSFTQFDEEIASAFSVYCCISIVHSLMYKNLQEAHNRNKLSIELMIYHMKVSHDDVDQLTREEIPPPTQIHPDFDRFLYSPRLLEEDKTTKAVISMMEDLNIISRWRIKKDTLARFLLMVRKGYRNPPYHNWMHAYSVAHFCYLLIKNLQLQGSLDEIEVFALFVSCLCHDIDHRGTNNSFQVASSTVLAALYSSEGSVMERHHFAQSMCIVNTDGCNIFENLSRKDYTKALDLVRDVILATDIGHHLKILKNLEAMAKEGYDVKSRKHHNLLLCVLMTACDLSDQTKNWKNTRKIAALIYQEFFSQGDMEKNLGKNPIEMMDRERARIPDLQISFLNSIALPVYRVIAQMFPSAQGVLKTVEDNKRHWEKISEFVKLQQDVPLTAEQMLEIDVEEPDPEGSSQPPAKKSSVTSVNGIKS